MDLAPEIRKTEWDVILIDGPAGYEGNTTPGRMKSIYESSRLIRQGGSVFVHDQEREVERAYSDRYLLKTNVVAEVKDAPPYVTTDIGRTTGCAIVDEIDNRQGVTIVKLYRMTNHACSSELLSPWLVRVSRSGWSARVA